jgi:hypothetical protein
MDYKRAQKQLVQEIAKHNPKYSSRMSEVPISTEFAFSKERCLTLVAFPDEQFCERVSSILISPLRMYDRAQHYYAKNAMHITIKNVRCLKDPPNFSKVDTDRVGCAFAERIAHHPPIYFSFEDILVLPTSIAVAGYCSRALFHLIRDLDDGLDSINFPDDKRYASDEIYFCNLTFCRFRRLPTADFFDRVRQLEWKPATLLVKKLNLISCNPVCDEASREIHRTFELAGEAVSP